MNETKDRLNSLMEWAKSTYGGEISQTVASESPQEEADFWRALNKARAARALKPDSGPKFGRSRLNS